MREEPRQQYCEEHCGKEEKRSYKQLLKMSE